jgi:frataxin-like iron-binding protein CyaY
LFAEPAACNLPCSGPCRFDWHEGRWIYHRTGQDLAQQLQQELEQLLGKKPEV